MHDPDGYFGKDVAGSYDDPTSEMFDPAVVAATVDVLTDLAGGGRALELGIGTGRIALPLASRGVPVHGNVADHLEPGGCFLIEVLVP